jgi:glycosyltransferase involved in cell wall biosynthesis
MPQWRGVRIALVVTGGVDRSGRVQVIPTLLALVERLAGRHDLFVYVLRYHASPCTYRLLGATVHDLGRPRGFVRQLTRTLAALRRDGPFDVIHGYWAQPAGLVAASAGRILRTPSVVTFDSGELVALDDIGYGLQRRWIHRMAVAATARAAGKITVCTSYMQRLARTRGICTEVLPLGVDRETFRAAVRPDPPPWRLLHVAHLNRVKDQPTLIEALRTVTERHTDAHLDIVGEDTLDGAIQELARRRGLSSHVTFHGVLPTDAVAELYRRAHLFVLSSRHEAAGAVVLEAAACGVPTVGTAVGYVADWAQDRAVAVPPADAQALAAGILGLMADRQRRERLATEAQEWALAHDADWTAREFERMYREISGVPQ